jgi:hypothetical protein
MDKFNFRALLLSVSVMSICGIFGCNPSQKALLGQAPDLTQSQSAEWSLKFKLQITKCVWKGNSLLVGVSMTYSGSDPNGLGLIPVFELQSPDGKHFQPKNGADADYQLMNSNYNFGSSVNVELEFPAPHGDYIMLVENGGYRKYVGVFPTSGLVLYKWKLAPTGI